ncbi:MAG: LamG-like jellyroll fold domain-containing protein, partial [Chloroflexota bacterium]
MPTKSPLENALAIWQMGATNHVSRHGAVQLNVPLKGFERKESLARGGNGRVAVFEGGYIGLDAAKEGLQIQGNAMSLCLRLRDVHGGWNVPLFSRDDAQDSLGTILSGLDGMNKPWRYTYDGETGAVTPYYHLFAEEGGSQRLEGTTALLEYQWRTQPSAEIIEFCEQHKAPDIILADARDGILRLNAPIAMVGATSWHDIVIRFADNHPQLFVDGVLIDEEWSYGMLHNFVGPFLLGAGWVEGQLKTGFYGQVDYVALWDRALSDDEINKLSGGEKHVKQRTIEILGPQQSVPNYWRPRGHNTYAGDCMLLWDKERLHLFFLFDRRHHTSKWNLGAHQYDHFSTVDLSQWARHPLAIPVDQPWECAIGTGDFIYHEGRYVAFFTDCGGRCQFEDKPHQGSGIFRATSSDGIHFIKDYTPIVPTTETGCADCSIFQDPATELFHLLTQDKAADGTLIIGHYVSDDLDHWTRQPKPFLESDIFGPCPHLFYWNEWYYFAMTNKLWKSHAIHGPWEQLQPEPLIQLYYPKTAPFKDNRFLTAGWVAHSNWGGDVVFRELIQHPDGSLGTKFVPEMVPNSGSPLNLAPATLSGRVESDGSRLTLSSAQESPTLITAIPANIRLTMRVEPNCAVWHLGLLDDAGEGVTIEFDRGTQQVSMSVRLNLWWTEQENPVISPISFLDHPFQ